MQLTIEARERNNSIMRQRNFFAGFMALAMIANFLLVAKISSTTERIIMVPGITKDLMIEGAIVSQSYLEETALLFASALLDLTLDTIEAKKNIILKHASKRSEQSLKSLQSYFASREEQQQITLIAPTNLMRDWIQNHYGQLIRQYCSMENYQLMTVAV